LAYKSYLRPYSLFLALCHHPRAVSHRTAVRRPALH
jgi:hypothetical protein